MKVAAAVLLLLLAAVYACSAQSAGGKTLTQALDENKHVLFGKIVECAGAKGAFSSSKGKITVLAPTDKAVEAFLAAMKVTPTQALAMEPLCDALVRYHVLPYALTSSQIMTKDAKGQTFEPRSFVTFNKAGGKITVTDMQGNVATVTKGDVTAGEAVLHSVDRVLLSDVVFTSVPAALNYHKGQHSTLVKAVTDAGLLSVFTDEKAPFKGTLLAPTNAAFDAAFKALGKPLTPAQTKDVLLYHVLKDPLLVPSTLKTKTTFATELKGSSVKFTLTTVDAKDQFGRAVKNSVVKAVPEVGKPTEVVKHNVFAGPAVVHGLEGVLLPKAFAPAATTAGRKLLQGRGGGAQAGDGTNLAFSQQGSLDAGQSAIQSASYGGGGSGY